MKQPLISVIIPVYGVEKYIAQCLESVIDQTYKNLEIIVINDGTKDRSAEIAKEYAAKDSRIKVYDFKNGGLSVARNRGLEIATGEYISYLDSDDWLDTKMYETLLETAMKNEADMVKCGIIETNGAAEEKITFSDVKIINNEQHKAFENYFKGILWTLAWNGLYKRELAKKVKFPDNVVHEDNYSSGMFLYLSKKVLVIPFCGNYYRVNDAGISKGGMKKPLDKILAIIKLKQDLLKLGFADKKLDWKLSVEFYHFVRGWNDDLYRVVAMHKDLYEYVMSNIDVRRKITFWWMCRKMKGKK
ncbi:glycosyltransferase family 2 protein [Phascolarctobacterium succinatutens]|uniref:glycosyltransferase family 2 protein n=1 Tax=Phascolarctobacterium succinatutens TaxID=626940 RepID=UPI0026F1F7AD|nr:glycosyltransferase [Phascolarctobacterium succinatutens]